MSKLQKNNNHNSLGVCFVNLISYMFLAGHQTSMAIHILNNYLKRRIPNIDTSLVDMQEIFDNTHVHGKNMKNSFSYSIDLLIQEIIKFSSKHDRVIIGLSMKWGTREIADKVITRLKNTKSSSNYLFILG